MVERLYNVCGPLTFAEMSILFQRDQYAYTVQSQLHRFLQVSADRCNRRCNDCKNEAIAVTTAATVVGLLMCIHSTLVLVISAITRTMPTRIITTSYL